MYWTSSSGKVELNITKAQATTASHTGDCSEDVRLLRLVPAITKQLKALDPFEVKRELTEYGAWDDVELSDHDEKLNRLLWLACCDIAEGQS